jgi:hypothetical protein
MTVLPPLMISPETVKLNAGQQMQFASTRGGAAMAATWSISPASGAGTITSSGLYTAPSTVTTQVTVTLTATTTVQLQQTNNATITLVPTAAPSAPTATPGTPNPNFYEVITWTTAALSTSQVEYGPTTAYGRWTTLTTTPGSQQTATTASLSAGLYHYRTHSYTSSGQDVVSQDYTFVTNNNITGPVISNIKVTVTNPTTVGNNNSATLTFSTNNAATAMVGYGPTTSYAYWPSQTTSTTTHSFQLQWLTSGTWNFVIYATDQFGNQTISSNITFQVP